MLRALSYSLFLYDSVFPLFFLNGVGKGTVLVTRHQRDFAFCFVWLIAKSKKASHSARSRSNHTLNSVQQGSRPLPIIHSLFKWCRERDSNPQGVTHMNLNHARLPISPSRHSFCYIKLSMSVVCGLAKSCVKHNPLEKIDI